MLPALIAAALQAAAAAPVPPAATPAAPVASPPADADAPTAEGLEDLRRTYHDSCELRVYGEYDDMCSALADQMRHYQAALAKAQRARRTR